MIQADQHHRDHAVIAQLIASSGRTTGPSALGEYTATAAWVALAVTVFHLARAATVAVGRARLPATLRRRIINVSRVATIRRRLVLR